MAELQGRMRRLSADIDIKRIRKIAEDIFGFQMATYAKAGVKLVGSPADVMRDSLKEAELDIIYTNISADYDVGIKKTEAGIYRMQAKSAKYGPIIRTGKTLLEMNTLYQLAKAAKD